MRAGIIGAGFAGVAAARVMAECGVGVTLFSAEKVPPYYRPRLPELAFGYDVPSDIFMHGLEWYADNGIDLRLDSEVKVFTPDFEVTLKDGKREKFDVLIIATGGGPLMPAFCRDCKLPDIFQLWNYPDAVNIREHLRAGKKLVIVGGGIIGLESALRAGDSNLKVTVIEKAKRLMPQNFGEKASWFIEAQLRERNIDLILDDSVSCFERKEGNRILVNTENKNGILCDLAIVSVGVGFNTSMAEAAGLKTGRRICVDKHLQTSAPGIFAAGDIAGLGVCNPCSVKAALAQGKTAGHNALVFLNGGKMEIYEPEPVPVNLKYKDFQLYSIGEIPGPGKDEKILDHEDMKTYRSCIYESNVLAGVEMVGTNKDFLKYQQELLVSGRAKHE
ncbi:MAG: FAD-dependent oxidoreductase [Victivallaceae bacterium]|nr:FAD-dependent oxidoreductase [Victivallaceae bacterium]